MYKKRNIKFIELITFNDWTIKSYTISEHEKFTSLVTYNKALESLPTWLNQINSFDQNHNNLSFLIIHEGREGVFVLINTWVGGNMLQTHVFLAKYNTPDAFTKISGDGLFACVWELEVINHEKKAWIKHVMKNHENPNYTSYLNDNINKRF